MPTQAQLHAEYQETFRRYTDLPMGGGAGTDLDAELEVRERALLDNPPEGIRPGLPEPFTVQRQMPDPRSVIPQAANVIEIPEGLWVEMVAQLNQARAFPSFHVWHTLNQASVGSCAAEGTNGAEMNLREMENQERVIFNPYGMYGRINGGRDQGANPADAIRFAQEYGCFPESVWPRSKGWQATPSKEAYEAAQPFRLREVVRINSKVQFGSCLLLGIPVAFGYPGHWIYATRLIDRSRFWYQNSWGNWGTDGGASLSFNSVQWGYGVWGFLTTTWAGPDPRLLQTYSLAV